MKTKELMKGIKAFGKKNAPMIATCVGVIGMTTSTILAVKATPKAVDILRAEEKRKGDVLTKKEVVKSCWKLYLPAFGVGAVSTACIIGGGTVSAKRQATLSAAYEMTRLTFKEYREKVADTIGKEKEKDISNEVMEKHEVVRRTIIEDSYVNDGNLMILEPITNQMFKVRDYEVVRAAINDANMRMMTEMEISVNEWCSLLGIRAIRSNDDNRGWKMSDGFLALNEPEAIVLENHTPALRLVYSREPEQLSNHVYR